MELGGSRQLLDLNFIFKFKFRVKDSDVEAAELCTGKQSRCRGWYPPSPRPTGQRAQQDAVPVAVLVSGSMIRSSSSNRQPLHE